MPRINPEQLEREADELLTTMANPPAEPDTDKPGQGAEAGAGGEDDPNKGVELNPSKPVETAPGDKPNEPPPEGDTGEDGLTLDNARERIRNAQARMHRATQEAAELRKKVASQDGELSALRSDVSGLNQQIEALKKAKPPASPDTVADDMSDAELQSMAEEYPTLAKPFIKQINALNNRVKELTDRLAKVDGKVTETVQSTKDKEKADADKAHFDAILAVHPDAFEVYESDDFNGWLLRQPPAFARSMKDGMADDVIYVFNEYKKAVGLTKPEPKGDEGGAKDRLAKARAAATPNVRQVRTDPSRKPVKPTFTRDELANMPQDEFERREAEIDEAMAEGRIA